MCVSDGCPLLTVENVGRYAVGKWLSNGTVNVEAFKAVMKSVWGVHKGTQIDSVGNRLFHIQFHTQAEKIRVFNVGPWSFDKGFLVLVSPRVDDQFLDLIFSETSFYVQIRNVPFSCLTKEMAMSWADFWESSRTLIVGVWVRGLGLFCKFGYTLISRSLFVGVLSLSLQREEKCGFLLPLWFGGAFTP